MNEVKDTEVHLVAVNIHDIGDVPEIKRWYIPVWVIRSVISNYIDIVRYQFSNIKFGNILKTLSILITGWIYSFQITVKNYSVLEDDLFLYSELYKRFTPSY